jgi:gas vesicle protein
VKDDFKPYNTTGVFTAPQSGTYTVTVGNGSPYMLKLPYGHTIDVKAFGNANTQLKEPTMTTEERKTLNKSSKKKLITRIEELKSTVQAYRDENQAKNQTITNLTQQLKNAESDGYTKTVEITNLKYKIGSMKQAIKALSDCL